MLFINTAFQRESVSVIDDRKVKAEKTWKSQKNEVSKLLPAVEDVCAKAKIGLADLDGVAVIAGPGPYSAIRIGVTVANMLGLSFGAELYMLKSTELLRLRALHMAQNEEQICTILSAGGPFVIYEDHKTASFFHIEEALQRINSSKSLVIGDLSEQQHKIFDHLKRVEWRYIPENQLPGIAETLAEQPRSYYKRHTVKLVTPIYWKPPSITTPQKR